MYEELRLSYYNNNTVEFDAMQKEVDDLPDIIKQNGPLLQKFVQMLESIRVKEENTTQATSDGARLWHSWTSVG